MKEKVIKCEVILVEGVSQKTGRDYQMLKIRTGDQALDNSLKPIFLTKLELARLNEVIK